MAVVARIWCPEFQRQIRPWNTKTVVAPPIDDHVGTFRHVAGRTGNRGIHIVMVAMRRVLIFCRRMTLKADAITRRPQRGAVRIMAVAAGHTQSKHLALLEWQVIVELLGVAHLSVGEGQVAIQRRNQMRIGKRMSRYPFFRKLCASCMTETAGLDLLAQA